MDVVNISRSRRFLRERPIHVNLFDRPRLVVDLLCLEGAQEESRRGFERSDSLVVLIEGEARLRAGPQIESLQEMDAVMVPPGQEYSLKNTGPGQVVALVLVAPKPTRIDEVRVPGEPRTMRGPRFPRDNAQPVDRQESSFRGAPFRARDDGEESRPQRDRPFPRRDDGERRPYAPRGEGDRRPPYPPRRDDGERRPYASRGEGDRRPYPRREDGERRPYGPRNGGDRPPYPRRDAGAGGRGGGYDRPRSFRQDGPRDDARTGPRRGTTGARPSRRDGGEGPNWSPKPKPAWRPRGPFVPGGPDNRGRPGTGSRDDDGPRRQDDGAARGARGRADGPGAGPGARRGPWGTGSRGGGGKSGNARRASRGQGPLSGRRGPGRSGPRT